MSLHAMLNSDICIRVVLALGHFLWQATAIALVAMVAAWVLRRSSANARYALLLAALLAMAACPPATFCLLGGPAAAVADLDETTSALPTAGSDTVIPAGGGQPGALGAAGADPAPVPDGGADHLPSPPRDPHPVAATGPAWPGWQRLAPHFTLVYIAGVVLMLCRLLVGLHGGRSLRKASQPVTDGPLLSALASQAKRVGLRAAPAVAWCGRIVAPAVVGVLRPMILLPVALAGNLSADQIESLLAHELAHIRRWDYLVNLLQRVIEAFLFFHPAVWLVSRRIRAEREHCCDDVAVAVGGRPASYAASLLDLAERSLDAPRRARGSLVAVGAGGRSAGLRSRVLRLLGASSDDGVHLRRTWPVALALAALVAAGLIAYGCATAGQTKAPDDAHGVADGTVWAADETLAVLEQAFCRGQYAEVEEALAASDADGQPRFRGYAAAVLRARNRGAAFRYYEQLGRKVPRGWPTTEEAVELRRLARECTVAFEEAFRLAPSRLERAKVYALWHSLMMEHYFDADSLLIRSGSPLAVKEEDIDRATLDRQAEAMRAAVLAALGTKQYARKKPTPEAVDHFADVFVDEYARLAAVGVPSDLFDGLLADLPDFVHDIVPDRWINDPEKNRLSLQYYLWRAIAGPVPGPGERQVLDARAEQMAAMIAKEFDRRVTAPLPEGQRGVAVEFREAYREYRENRFFPTFQWAAPPKDWDVDFAEQAKQCRSHADLVNGHEAEYVEDLAEIRQRESVPEMIKVLTREHRRMRDEFIFRTALSRKNLCLDEVQ